MGSDNKPTSKVEEVKTNYGFLLMFVFMPLIIGSVIAMAIFTYGNRDKYAQRIADVAAEDTHWVHLAIVVLGRMISFINARPMAFKKGLEGNIRSNPFIYKVVSTNGGANDVIFDSEGNNGKYNRANRSVHHMLENFGAFIIGIIMVGGIFPFPAFLIVCLFSVGRILHQAGYMEGYGKHGVGFLISMIASVTMEGLSLVVFLKGLGIIPM